VDTGVPAADLADQERRLRGKFLVLASPRLGSRRAEALADAVAAFEEAEALGEVLRLSCGSGAA
jgi:hypothetical protein